MVASALWMPWHRKIYGVVARLFDAKQKLADGAFLASLIADVNPDDLIAKGKQRLRRVPAKNITHELLKSNKSSVAESRRLSEPCEVGDIDFFISHSWSDPPEAKFQVLEQVRKSFELEHGRAPYFWLDKLCVDQTSEDTIKDDLQCLPVFLMACNQMLVVAGETYPQRLWCAW